MKKIFFLIISILLVFTSGCFNIKTPGQSISPPKHTDTVLSKSDNLPSWSIKGGEERFFDTTFMDDKRIATLVYKNGEIFLRTYEENKIIAEKDLGAKADYRIIDSSRDRLLIKNGEGQLILYNSNLDIILAFNADSKNDGYQREVSDGILSPDGNTLAVSYIYYKNNDPEDGRLVIFNGNKAVSERDSIIPLLANFSDDGSKFLVLDLNRKNIGNYNTFVYDANGNIIKETKLPIYSNTAKGNINVTKVSAALSGDGNSILFSDYYGDGVYIKKLGDSEMKIPMTTEKYYSNKDASKFVIGNYGVSKIYNSSGKLLDYIVINNGLVNDVTFDGSNTYFAVNGTTMPNLKGKDYIGVMDESGNLIWAAKVYDVVAMLRFSPDGKRIMAQSSKFISVYDYHNGKVDIIPHPVNGKYPELLWKKPLSTEANAGNAYIKTDMEGNIYIARYKSLIKLNKNGNHYWIVSTDKPIDWFELSYDGRMAVLSISDDSGSEMIVYNEKGMVISHKYINKGHKITSIAVSPDGKFFAYAVSTPENREFGSFIDLFNDKGYMIWEQKIKSSGIYNLNVNDNIVTASFNEKLSGYIAIDLGGRIIFNEYTKNNLSYINSSLDGKKIFAGGLNSGFGIYNRDGTLINDIYIKGEILQYVLISDDGKTSVVIASSDNFKKYEIVFVKNFKIVKKVNSDWGIVKAFITPDGKYTAVLSEEYSNVMNNANKITLYDSEGNALYTYYHKSGVYDISLTDDGMYLYAYSADGYVYKYRNR